MKKINDELTDFSIRSIIAKNNNSINSIKNSDSNNSFSSFLKEDKDKDFEDDKSEQVKTSVQEQILNQEAYLNKMVIETLAS